MGKAIRPFDHGDAALLEEFIEADFVDLGAFLQPVKIKVKNREPAAPVFMNEREGGAGRFLRAFNALEQTFTKCVLPAPRSPTSATTSLGRSVRAQSRAKAMVSSTLLEVKVAMGQLLIADC